MYHMAQKYILGRDGIYAPFYETLLDEAVVCLYLRLSTSDPDDGLIIS